MVNERWIVLLIVIGAIGVLWRTPALAAVAVIGLTIIVISLILRERTLRKVRYQRRLNETRVFIGETVNVACRVTNDGRLPIVSLLTRDDAPRGFIEVAEDGTIDPEADPSDLISLSQAVSLKSRAFASRTFSLKATRRGHFPFKPAALNALDLLALAESERVDNLRDGILVYPRVFSMDELELPPQQPLGEVVALRRFIEDPSRNMGARDYQPGDPFRMIHWKATAHRGALQTRVSEHTSDPTTMILLNVMTFPEDWYGVEVERFEWAVSVAASIATWAHESGATIGLSSNGCTPGLPEALRVKPRRSPDQLAKVLESLAFISAFTLSRFEEFLLSEQRNIPFGATLLIVSPIFTPKIAEAIHRLHTLGKRIAVVCVDTQAPDISGLPCPMFHLPPNPQYAAWSRQYASVNEKEEEAG
jgi:uncharacterized protein (DUF58 family)